MTFQAAVRATPALARHCLPGLRALSQRDRHLITTRNTRRIQASVSLERALRPTLPDDPIWDYGVGIEHGRGRSTAIWIEPHPASSSHLESVLGKLAWLHNWLRQHAPRLNSIEARYVWVATGRVELPANSPKRRLIAVKGLEFCARRLDLYRFVD